MTDLAQALSLDYRTARARLHAAAAGWSHRAWPHPLLGPDGGALATDTYRLGPRDAKRLLILNSGTHGLEGLLGSGVQLALVERGLTPGPDLAVLLIHAINPFGFAWRRRVNEDGVDLNRNFVDFSAPLPVNEEFLRHAAAIDPDEWPDVPIASLSVDSDVPRAAHAGQYDDPTASAFGGHGPTWSNRTLHAIYDAEVGAAETILLFDIHTGAGPYAATEFFVAEPAASGIAAEWFPGAERFVIAKTARFGDPSGVTGLLLSSLPTRFPDRTTIACLSECGTYQNRMPATVARRDTWVQRKGVRNTPMGQRWALEAQEIFGPADPSWRRYSVAGVLARIDEALRGLA